MAIKVSGIVVIDDSRNIYGSNIYSNGAEVLTTASTNLYVKSIIAGTDTAVSTSTSAVVIWNTSTLQSITLRGSSTNVALSITNTTESTSTATGSLTITGGAGIGGNLYVGGVITGNLTGNASTATSAGIAYSLANTSTTYVGQAVLADFSTTATSAGIAYSLANTSTTYVGQAVLADFSTTATSAGIAYSLANTSTTYVGQAVLADLSFNIFGGSANQIVYQTLTSTTNFISAPSFANTCLKWNGSSFIWEIPFNGGTITNALIISDLTQSVSTITGALTVEGGAGIGQNLNVGGSFRASTGATSQQTIDNASGTVDLNFGLHDHFLLNMTGNVTLTISNLDNKIGCTGNILFQQDSTGGWTFVKPPIMKTPLGGATIIQTTSSDTLSLLTYYVVNTTTVIVNYIGDFA